MMIELYGKSYYCFNMYLAGDDTYLKDKYVYFYVNIFGQCGWGLKDANTMDESW